MSPWGYLEAQPETPESGLGQGSCFKTLSPTTHPLPRTILFPQRFQWEAPSRQPLRSLCPLGVPQAGHWAQSSPGGPSEARRVCHGYSLACSYPPLPKGSSNLGEGLLVAPERLFRSWVLLGHVQFHGQRVEGGQRLALPDLRDQPLEAANSPDQGHPRQLSASPCALQGRLRTSLLGRCLPILAPVF